MSIWSKIFDKPEREQIEENNTDEKQFSKKDDLSKEVDEQGSQKLLQKRLNKLKHKALYIDAEYEEMCDVFSHAQSEFISCMFSYCSDNKIRPPFGDKKKDEDKQKIESSEEIKDLYREIVKVTHPDKTKDLPEHEIEERKELYHEAVRGKQEGDYWGIFKAALELNVPIKKLSFGYLDELDNTIQSLEQKIQKMREDLMYKWFFADKDLKEKIFQQITKDQEKYE